MKSFCEVWRSLSWIPSSTLFCQGNVVSSLNYSGLQKAISMYSWYKTPNERLTCKYVCVYKMTVVYIYKHCKLHAEQSAHIISFNPCKYYAQLQMRKHLAVKWWDWHLTPAWFQYQICTLVYTHTHSPTTHTCIIYTFIHSAAAAAAASAKSLQLCLTLCDPIDGSPPGSPVPGILQARILEWVAISSSNEWKWKVKVKLLSRVQLLVTPWTTAHQAPPSMGFSRQEYWSGVHCKCLRKGFWIDT